MTRSLLQNSNAFPTDVLSRKSQEAAKHRRELREQTRNGTFTLADLFSLIEQDRTLGRTRIKVVLLWLPNFGKVKVCKVLEEASVSPTRRLTALRVAEKERLLADPRVVQHAAAVACQRANGGVA